MQTFELITNTIAGAIDFKDNDLEAAFKRVFTAGGKAMISALSVDSTKTEGDDVSEQLEGLVDLAKTYAESELTAAQAVGLKVSVAKIVKIPANVALETALENTFSDVLDGVGSALELNDVVDAYNPPDETGN